MNKKKIKILVIDDQKEIRNLLVRDMPKFGYEVTTVESGSLALCLLKHGQQLDLILLDEEMPDGMSGIATNTAMRALKLEQPLPPVVMLTANNTAELSTRFMEDGGTSFIAKPCRSGFLDFRIREILERMALKRENKALEIAKIKAETANQFRTDVLDVLISHELRTYLTLILGNTANLLLRKNIFETNDQVALETINQGGKNLFQLTESIEYLSHILTGMLKPKSEVIDFDKLFQDCREQISEDAKKKKLELNFRINDELYLDADQMLLKVILSHLAQNAIKFTNQGTVELVVKVGEDEIIISVTDTGIGIDSKEHQNIFDRLYKIDKSGHKLGTGLGLHICFKLINLMHGRIWVESELGKGSTFYIALPKQGKELKDGEKS